MVVEKEKVVGTGAASKKAVVIYSVALFVVVVVFIAISYLINERGQDKVDELHEQQTTALQKIDTLRSENERLQEELQDSAQREDELEDEIKQLHLDWAEDTKRIEDRYKADFNVLLGEYNELLAQLEAAAETEQGEE